MDICKRMPVLFLVMLFIANTGYSQQTAFVAPASADAMKNPFAGNEKAIVQGKVLYASLCVACHGDKGKGDGVASAGLTVPPADHTSAKVQNQSDGAIFWKVFTGKGPMPSFRSLPQEQVWQLVTYIRTLSKKPKK